MSRIEEKVNIPQNQPEAFLSLIEKILSKHELLGKDSPLRQLDMVSFKALKGIAEETRAEAEFLRARADRLTHNAEQAMGTGKGQTENTPGTLYHLCLMVRDQLMSTFENDADVLQAFGFECNGNEEQNISDAA